MYWKFSWTKRFWDSAPGKAFLWWSPVQVPFPDTGSSTEWNRWKCWKPGSPSRESYCTLQSFELKVSSSRCFTKCRSQANNYNMFMLIYTLACICGCICICVLHKDTDCTMWHHNERGIVQAQVYKRNIVVVSFIHITSHNSGARQ